MVFPSFKFCFLERSGNRIETGTSVEVEPRTNESAPVKKWASISQQLRSPHSGRQRNLAFGDDCHSRQVSDGEGGTCTRGLRIISHNTRCLRLLFRARGCARVRQRTLRVRRGTGSYICFAELEHACPCTESSTRVRERHEQFCQL